MSNIQGAWHVSPIKGSFDPPKGIVTHRLRIAAPESYPSPCSLPDAHFIHTPSSTHRVLCQKCLHPLCYWPDNFLHTFKTQVGYLYCNLSEPQERWREESWVGVTQRSSSLYYNPWTWFLQMAQNWLNSEREVLHEPTESNGKQN